MRFENLGMYLELWTLGLGFDVRDLGIGVVFEIANFGVGLRHTVDFGNVTADPFKVKKIFSGFVLIIPFKTDQCKEDTGDY